VGLLGNLVIGYLIPETLSILTHKEKVLESADCPRSEYMPSEDLIDKYPYQKSVLIRLMC
jgi:hypothetical protein